MNSLTFMEDANYNDFLLEQKQIKKDLVYDLARRCGFKVLTHSTEGRVYYRLKKVGIPCERLYTHEEKTTFNYLDLADLHIGNSDCQIGKIRYVLNEAVKNKVDYVFIAGDVLDGLTYPSRKDVKEIYKCQIGMAFFLFKDYPNLDFRVIPGNHDFTFDFFGIKSPLRFLEERLRAEGCKFTVYDGYIQDFEMAGVVKRMMHLESFYYQDNVLSAIERLHVFKEHGGLQVKCIDGVRRPIRFLQCGHVHKTVEIYNSDFNVYITQPGCFIKDKNYYSPSIHVVGEVLNDLRIVRE